MDQLSYTPINTTYNGLDDSSSGRTIGPADTGLGENAFTDTGTNYIDGGDGDDLIVGANGQDTLIGGAGRDTIDGGAGIDTIEGGGDRDIIGGGAGNDAIAGGSGADYIDGGADDDYIYGQEGEDLVFGGTGKDVLFGGEGSDVFFFRSGDGPDIIMDFVAGSQADAVALQGTGLGSFAEVQAHLSFYEPGNATLLQIGADQIFFVGVKPGQFDASDFFFS